LFRIDVILKMHAFRSGLGLSITDCTAGILTLYRGATDVYWNYIRVKA